MYFGLPFHAERNLDADVRAWVSSVRAAGSNVSAATQRHAHVMVRALKQARLWEKIYMLDCCAGDNLTASLVRLKVPAGVARAYTNNNFVAADYTERGASGGLKGDGTTKYLNTLLNPAAQGWVESDFMLWGYFRETSPAGTTRIALGQETTAPNITQLAWAIAGSAEVIRIATNSATASAGSAKTGLIGGGTKGTRAHSIYVNGALSAEDVGLPTPTFINVNIYAHCGNVNGSPAAFNLRRTSQLIISKGLTAAEVRQLYSVVQGFESAMGRAV